MTNILEMIFSRANRKSDQQVITELSEAKFRLNKVIQWERELKWRMFQDAAQTIGIFNPEMMMKFHKKWEKELNSETPKKLKW